VRPRRLLAAAAIAATVLAPLAVLVSPPAQAVPVDVGWAASGPGIQPGGSDGSAAAASFAYSVDPAGIGVQNTWLFKATATQTGQVTVPYTWQGLHAWFAVTTSLDMFVAHPGSGVSTTHLLGFGPTNCCTSPSNGFLYGGVVTFDVQAGDTYGFQLSGSNSDSNNFLRGTFTLSTKPYVDATLAGDNRDWPGAVDLATAPAAKREIKETGEARWFKFPVVPNQNVSVTLTNPSGDDYDIALYGDISAAYDKLSGDPDLLAASADGVPLSDTQVPDYPAQVTSIPDANGSQTFAPRIYAPRIYAPRIYAPRIYAPRIYAPRIYAPDSYVPDLAADSSFQQAFSAAQNQTLLAVSATAGSSEAETVSASSGNTDGYFYVRVQGHHDQAFDAGNPFSLQLDTGDSGCGTLSDFSGTPLTPTVDPAAPATPATVIVTDSGRMNYAEDADGNSETHAQFLGHLGDLAGATDGVVLDMATSPRVQALWGQVQDMPDCPYAVNLVASAVDQVVESYRNADSAYVVLAGGDDVIPFFRYPDVSGLGEESQFDPPMSPGSPADASLKQDQVLSQDAYGSQTDVTIGGATMPLPDLAVGRLVKTDTEIDSTIADFLSLGADHTLPTPTSSLVTGYDFLADAAGEVQKQVQDALGPDAPDGAADTLISQPGTATPWTADDLRAKLLGSTHHDLVFLAGHFSANDTLAADFTSTLNAAELADPANAGKLADTLVLSAGCHSGYNIVDGQAVPNITETNDWTQRMAQQHAILVGGTGYQYGDSDFLEYSERLYLDLAKRLHDGTSSSDPAVRIGQALALAKQDYLAGVTTMTGIDQKAMLEATLYGLPMTGFAAPGRTPLATDTAHVDPTAVGTVPGSTLGLRTIDKHYDTPTQAKDKPSGLAAPHPDKLSWLQGADGVSVQPGVPALPKQVEDVTPVEGLALRGVGFRSGTYSDSTGLLPLTGAPAIEGDTPNSTFESGSFFPERLTTVNYFGALGASGRTSLILTPGQYRTDANADPSIPTDTQRVFSDLDVRLFYSGATANGSLGGNQPVQAAPPAIGNVTGVVSAGVVTFSATVTGDPSAGVQQVWVTYTGDRPGDYGHGRWDSVDLTQDPTDSTRWTGTLVLPAGQTSDGMRFLVQAANGVGAVSLDTAGGGGYLVSQQGTGETAEIALQATRPSSASPLGVSATVTDGDGPVADRTVRFTVVQGGVALFDASGVTDSAGHVVLTLPSGHTAPTGLFDVVGFLLDSGGLVTSSDTLTNVDTATISLQTAGVTLTSPYGVTALVTDASGAPWAGRDVTVTVGRTGATSTLYSYPATTDAGGSLIITGDDIGPASGPVTIRVELLAIGDTSVRDSATTDVTVDGLVITPSPAFLTARAGTAFGTLTVQVTDGRRGDEVVTGVPVTLTLPGGTATFASDDPSTVSPTLARVTTGDGGVATVPAMTASTAIGTFLLTASTSGATDATVPMASQYGYGAFGSPVSSTTTTTSTGTTPVKVAALLADGTQLSDSDAAALVTAGRVQVRWREVGTTTWSTRSGLVTYDSKKHFFQADLKASSLGWVKSRSYTVDVRILPATTDAQPQPQTADDVLQRDFDLGDTSFTITVTK
jgi:hypothetical protein